MPTITISIFPEFPLTQNCQDFDNMPEDNEAEEYADEDLAIDTGLGAIRNHLIAVQETRGRELCGA